MLAILTCRCGAQYGPTEPVRMPLCMGCAREARGLPRFRPMLLVREPNFCHGLWTKDGSVSITNRMDDR